MKYVVAELFALDNDMQHTTQQSLQIALLLLVA
jgi:hypothetical protein